MGKVFRKQKLVRVLIVGMHDKIGGVETFLMNYYRNIDKKKIQFDFINPYESLCFEDEIKKMGGKIYNISNFKKHPVKYYKQIKNVIKENSYDIVHVNMLSLANIVPLLAAKTAKAKRIIAHSHNSSMPAGIIRKIMHVLNKKIALKSATDFFACSKLAGNWMFGDKIKFTVINNAIEIEHFSYNEKMRNEVRKQLNVVNNFVVGHIGRFSEQKNHEYLIEIFRHICEIKKDAKLLLIGDGELKHNIVDKVNQYSLEDNVIFLGNVSNPQDYYQAMDVFVLPSLFEGLPVVGIEALTSGTVCYFSDTITKELDLTDFSNFLSLEKKPAFWAKKIVEYYGKKSINNSKLLENYDIKKEAKKLEIEYEKLL